MNYLNKITAALYGLATLLTAVGLAWLLLMKCDYLYGVWHDHGGIAEAIEKFGPQNRYRKGFENTTKEQRVVLFAQIAESVHHNGEGLEKIFYTTPDNSLGTPLLQQSEITHLKDVAKLISYLSQGFILVFFIWLVFTVVSLFRKKVLPKIAAQLTGFSILFGLGAIVILMSGWENVFNQLHIWIFPAEHQWFFYYQDSLMSTMMWAPHLFTYIGISWLLLTILFFVLLLLSQRYLNTRILKRPKN